MKKFIKGTGIFAGLSVPESCRGKFVLVADGKVVEASASAKRLVQKAAGMQVKPAIFGVPEDDHAIAAY